MILNITWNGVSADTEVNMDYRVSDPLIRGKRKQRMREAAKMMGDNSHNYGSDSRKGAISRGKMRSRADRAG